MQNGGGSDLKALNEGCPITFHAVSSATVLLTAAEEACNTSEPSASVSLKDDRKHP